MIKAINIRTLIVTTIASAALFMTGVAFADNRPLGTSFTYQNRLAVSGKPAQDNYDFAFML